MGACVYVGDTDRTVPFYRDTLGFHTAWDGGDFAEFETASGELTLFMSSRKQFAETIGETYVPPKGINQTFEIALWLPRFADVDADTSGSQRWTSAFRPEHPSPSPLAFAPSLLPIRRGTRSRSDARANRDPAPLATPARTQNGRAMSPSRSPSCWAIRRERNGATDGR